MRTLTQRVATLERTVRQIRRDIAGVEREMRERTRPTSRIGFEVFDEQDWEIGDARWPDGRVRDPGSRFAGRVP